MADFARRAVIALGFAAIIPARAQAPLRVLCSTALQPAMGPIGAGFAQAQGSPAHVTFATTGAVLARLRAGEPFAVIIATRAALASLAGEGRVAAPSIIGIATMAVGVAIRAGQPRPDIATPEALRAALLGAGRIAYSDPASGGTSGVHFAAIVERLGLTEALRAKAVPVSGGGSVGEVVARGEADLGIQMLSELRAVPGLDLLGALPDPLGNTTPLAAGLAPGEPDAGAMAFLAFLRTPSAQDAMGASGLTVSM
ncbi:molybdate ABC transporter substrate-binding protein [Plastoroseomonas arctica]|uniref:ABC transporter substrate-binding protein n=1 Tax=Plastoroseomonas arctica TaxID=1509237 RepID=A0AAF1KKG2_9PROT|nr:substrate-binding domain-containing protein [Plastoroseomonas arctica]MBR0653516.1 ABC transporter substrate-binding protein [Plastoroseomonas arctica]